MFPSFTAWLEAFSAGTEKEHGLQNAITLNYMGWPIYFLDMEGVVRKRFGDEVVEFLNWVNSQSDGFFTGVIERYSDLLSGVLRNYPRGGDVKALYGKLIDPFRQCWAEADKELDEPAGVQEYADSLRYTFFLMKDHIGMTPGDHPEQLDLKGWLDVCTRAVKRVIDTLFAMGVRRSARVPIMIHRGSGEGNWLGQNVVGGAFKDRVEVDIPTVYPGEAYATELIAHELGHVIYDRLHPEDKMAALRLAQRHYISDYGRPDWGEDQGILSLAHQAGSEWFAEMLANYARDQNHVIKPIQPEMPLRHPALPQFKSLVARHQGYFGNHPWSDRDRVASSVERNQANALRKLNIKRVDL